MIRYRVQQSNEKKRSETIKRGKRDALLSRTGRTPEGGYGSGACIVGWALGGRIIMMSSAGWKCGWRKKRVGLSVKVGAEHAGA